MRKPFLCAMLLLIAIQPALANEKQIGKLREQLGSSDARTQISAAGQLGKFGPLAAAAVPDLITAMKTNDLALKHEAIIALGQIGPEAKAAVPQLQRTLYDKSAIVRHSAMHSIRMIGETSQQIRLRLQSLLRDKDPLMAVSAAWTLSELYPDDATVTDLVLPVLLSALEHRRDDIRNDAVLALASIGEPAVKVLSERIGEHGPVSCMAATDALAAIGPDAAPAVPKLLETLTDKDSQVCWHAARALGAIRADADKVVPALAEQLGDESPAVRANAAYALGRYGADAKPAVAKLAETLKDEDANVRLAAARALTEIGPAAADAVDSLAAALTDDTGAVTLQVAEALGRIGSPAVGVLTEKLGDENLRPLAAAVLGEMGADARSAVPALVKLLDSEEMQTRREAFLALASIGPDAETAAPALMKILTDADDPGRAGAAYALAKIGAKDALPELKKLTDSDDELLALASAWGLVVLEPDDEENLTIAVPQLIGALSWEAPLARRESAIVLGDLGPKAKVAIPELIEALKKEQVPDIRAELLHALAEMGPDASEAMPEALAALDSPDPQLRATAVYLLGRVGEAAEATTPRIREVLKSGDEFNRMVAAWALIRIKPNPEDIKAAVPLLIRGLQDNRPRIRAEAAHTLGDVGGPGPLVVAALKKALEDDDEQVRNAAKEALAKLKDSPVRPKLPGTPPKLPGKSG